MTDLDQINVTDALANAGDLTGADSDPLADAVPAVEAIEQGQGFDLFRLFLAARNERENLAENTLINYRQAFGQWRTHMAAERRHPACASERHVRRYIERVLEGDTPPDAEREWRPNKPASARRKLILIKAAYAWFAAESSIGSHPATVNPVKGVHRNFPYQRWEQNADADGTNRLPAGFNASAVASALAKVTHIRDRAIFGLGLLLGTRSRELANMKLKDVHIANDALLSHYDGEMATNPRLRGKRNAVVIPSNRKGNKSKRDRIMPLNDEARKLLLDYLLIRWDNGEPWLFLTKQDHGWMGRSGGRSISELWAESFWPHMDAERPEGLSSHAARHLFTTHFETNTNATSPQIDYMRGDKPGDPDNPRAADAYVNTFYADITEVYDEIYRLGIV